MSVAPSEFVTMSHTIEQEVDGVRCNGAFVPLEPTAVTYTDVSNLPGFVGFPLFIKTNVETTDTREQVRAFSFTTNMYAESYSFKQTYMEPFIQHFT